MTRAVRTSKSLLACLAVVATACAGSSPERADQPGPSTTSEPAVKGGTVVVRMVADPGCWDPFSTCGPGGSFSWMLFPKTVNFLGGKTSATALLAAEPVIEKGPPQRLTYKLNPRAVWSDGTPITSSDLRYTWDQGANSPGVPNRTGWEQIASVDDSDPRTAVITFKQPYAAWTNPFGALGFVLPKHLLEGKDRLAEMRDAPTWSGGPWKIDRWTKGQEIRFVPNPNYWGEKPHLDALVFRIIFDAGAALTAYRSGQVSMIVGTFPPEITLAELQAIPSTTVDVITAIGIGQLVFNTQKPPLDSVPVRQALAYATDRDALVKLAGGLIKPDIKPIHSLMTAAAGRWYIEPYTKYRRDLGRVDQLMRGAGWTRGSDGIWAKGGQRAEVEFVGPAGNKALELQEQFLQSQWKEAGFEAKVNNVQNSGELLRRGAFHVAFGPTSFPSDDPSRCALMCSRNIPTDANGFTGGNISRIADTAHDAAWDLVNSEVDEAKRMEALKAAYAITTELVPVLPTAPALALLVYNNDRLRGVVNEPGPSGPDTTKWFCVGGTC